jgi:hypothetical protein
VRRRGLGVGQLAIAAVVAAIVDVLPGLAEGVARPDPGGKRPTRAGTTPTPRKRETGVAARYNGA